MHDDSATDSNDFLEPEDFDSEPTTRERREQAHERYMLIGVAALAVIAVAIVGWRLIPRSNETSAAYIDPLTQICAVDEEALIALGGEPARNDAFWDGLHLIGEHSILPGTYQSTGAGTCYWARLSGTTGADGEIIDSAQASGGPQTVTIQASDTAFTSMGCGEWHAVTP